MDVFANRLAPWLSSGSLLAIPLAILGGLITAFNPCCLPMYPAVFGFFGASCCERTTVSDSQHQVKMSRPIVAVIAFPFVLGMATATALMGLLTAALDSRIKSNERPLRA